jgi:hypothetical protein
VRTDREGRFSFLGVPQGTHAVRVTWVGFTPQNQAIDVGSSDVTVDIVLVRLTVLDTVAVTAKRTGLCGSLISRDSLMPVPGARVEIIGARKTDSTNSSGIFNLPELKPGRTSCAFGARQGAPVHAGGFERRASSLLRTCACS